MCASVRRRCPRWTRCRRTCRWPRSRSPGQWSGCWWNSGSCWCLQMYVRSKYTNDSHFVKIYRIRNANCSFFCYYHVLSLWHALYKETHVCIYQFTIIYLVLYYKMFIYIICLYLAKGYICRLPIKVWKFELMSANVEHVICWYSIINLKRTHRDHTNTFIIGGVIFKRIVN